MMLPRCKFIEWFNGQWADSTAADHSENGTFTINHFSFHQRDFLFWPKLEFLFKKMMRMSADWLTCSPQVSPQMSAQASPQMLLQRLLRCLLRSFLRFFHRTHSWDLLPSRPLQDGSLGDHRMSSLLFFWTVSLYFNGGRRSTEASTNANSWRRKDHSPPLFLLLSLLLFLFLLLPFFSKVFFP